MRWIAIVTVIASVMTGIAASPQTLQTAGSKIAVFECNPHTHTMPQAHPWIDPYGITHYNPSSFPYWDAFLGIVYENRADVSATEVDFGLVAGGGVIAEVKDIGNFAPGVKIDHEFVVSREIFPLASTPYCSVLRVKYADGSAWANPAPI
jgi:hypothetical protein